MKITWDLIWLWYGERLRGEKNNGIEKIVEQRKLMHHEKPWDKKN